MTVIKKSRFRVVQVICDYNSGEGDFSALEDFLDTGWEVVGVTSEYVQEVEETTHSYHLIHETFKRW